MMLICIEGCIGVGKTTLARILSKRLGAEGIYEDFENNPFLTSFYKNPVTFAFHVQVCFLLLQHAKLLPKVAVGSAEAKYVTDFTIIKTEIFSSLILTTEQQVLLTPIYHYLAQTIQKPSLVVYLYGTVPLIIERIRQRARPTDLDIQEDYISYLSAVYHDFFSHYTEVPTLSIDITAFDCHYSSDVDNLLIQIQQRIGIR